MLDIRDTGHDWKLATPDARRELCGQLAAKLGRDEAFLLAALDDLFDRGDPKLLDSPIEEVAKISVVAMHLRPSG